MKRDYANWDTSELTKEIFKRMGFQMSNKLSMKPPAFGELGFHIVKDWSTIFGSWDLIPFGRENQIAWLLEDDANRIKS